MPNRTQKVPALPQEPPDFSAFQPASDALEAKWNLFNAAAKKDLHWWFFALLMIGMTAITLLYMDMRKEREQLRSEISQVRQDQLAYMSKKNEALIEVLINNTKALESNTHIIQKWESKQ